MDFAAPFVDCKYLNPNTCQCYHCDQKKFLGFIKVTCPLILRKIQNCSIREQTEN
jgi:hypothetical protein